MELFKSGFRSVLGAQTETSVPSGAETVERLIERARSSTLLEDRRDACRALKALSRTYRMEVGAQGLEVLKSVLRNDRSDSEIIGYALDTLCNVTARESFEEERAVSDVPLEELETLGERFTEIYLKKAENVSLILGLLEEYDFHVRWPAVKLLTHLILNKPKELQECILISPMGVSRFMDLLSDTREVIRNDALLLLFQLTRGNANIQKIVAFENAFDKLFDVILEEGHSDGGVVVEDCLHLLLNLLKNNPSNQTFFKEGSYIQKICPFFDLSMPESDFPLGWPAQKVVNVQLMLQVLQTMVSPYRGAGGGEVQSCQQVMKSCGLVEKLCKLLMTPGVPADVLTEIIHTVGDMIRSCKPNQDYFAELLAPSNPPRKALVILLMSMVNDKQPFSLRCAVLYVFECYLFRNDDGKSQVVQTLLPSSSAQVTSISVGQLLCSGLLSTVDNFAIWCSAVALSHTLVDSPQQRERLLRVHLAISHGSKPVPLLEQCSLILQQATKVQPRLGILMLLCQWLAHCPTAVTTFLALQSTVPYLISQVGSTDSDENEDLVQSACAFLMSLCILFNEDSDSTTNRESLKILISKRIGLDKFLDKLAVIGRHEVYAKVLKSPQLRYKSFLEPLLDHEFARLHKSYEGAVVTALSGDSTKPGSNGLIDSARVEKLQASLDHLTEENRRLKAELEEARRAGSLVPNGPSYPYPAAAASSHLIEGQLSELRSANDRLLAELGSREEMIERLQATMKERDATIASLNSRASQKELSQDTASHVLQLLDAERTRLSRATTELESLRRDQENMMDLLTEYETKIGDYARRLKELGQEVDEDDLDEDLDVSEIESTVSDENRRVHDTSALV